MRIEKIRMRHCILSLVKSKLMSHVKTIDDDEKSAVILKTLLVMTRMLLTEGDYGCCEMAMMMNRSMPFMPSRKKRRGRA